MSQQQQKEVDVFPQKVSNKKGGGSQKEKLGSNPDLMFKIWSFFLSESGYLARHGYVYNQAKWMVDKRLFRESYNIISFELKKKKKKKEPFGYNMVSFRVLAYKRQTNHRLFLFVIDNLRKETLKQILEAVQEACPLSKTSMTILLVAETSTTQSLQQLKKKTNVISFDPRVCLSHPHRFFIQPKVQLFIVDQDDVRNESLDKLPLISKKDPLIRCLIEPSLFNKTYMVKIERICHNGIEHHYKICF